MKKKKASLESQINQFLEKWDCKSMTNFLRDIAEIYELYDVDEDADWVEESVGEENMQNVRLIRTVYLISRLASRYSPILASLKCNHPRLWERIEKEGKECNPK